MKRERIMVDGKLVDVRSKAEVLEEASKENVDRVITFLRAEKKELMLKLAEKDEQIKKLELDIVKLKEEKSEPSPAIIEPKAEPIKKKVTKKANKKA